MIAARRGRSSTAEPHESAFPGLDDGALEALAGDIELEDRLAVDLDRPLADQRPRLASRGGIEEVDQQLGQVDLSVIGQNCLWHLVGRLVLAHDAREVLLPPPRTVVAAPAKPARL